MRILNSLLSIILLLSASFACYAGVQVGTTRIIYAEGKKEVSVSLDNQDITPYLIKSWIENDKNVGTHFLLTPPLFRLEGKQKNVVRILSLTVSYQPTESHFSFLIQPQFLLVQQRPIVIHYKLRFVPNLNSFFVRKA